MLRIRGLTKIFAGQSEPTLKQIDLEVPAGQFCVILGNNGSGKSTFLRVLSGEYEADAGEIAMGGVAMTRAHRSSIVASIVQDVNAGTIGSMTVLENMVLSLQRVRGGAFSFYQKEAATVEKMIAGLEAGLERFLHLPMSSLSGGQRQMIATLMAIHSRPQVLLLDEHTAALDPKMQQVLMRYTARAVTAHAMTTLMITHKLEDALEYGDRIILLQNGVIALDVSGAEKGRLTMSDLVSLFHNSHKNLK